MPTPRLAVLCLTIMVCASASALAAQTAAPAADSSTAILAPLVGSQLKAHAPGWSARGELLTVRPPDSMLLQTARNDTLRQVSVRLLCVTHLERLDGHYSRAISVVRGGGVGLAVGFALGGLMRLISGNSTALASAVHTRTPGRAVVAIGLTSGFLGAVIGATKGVERWRSVPLPTPSPFALQQRAEECRQGS